MIGMFIGNARIGTICRFVGNPKSQRWVAWTVYRVRSDEERSARFARRRDAIDWLTGLHSHAGEVA